MEVACDHDDNSPARRVEGACRSCGGACRQTSHAFILDAIAERVDEDELRSNFHAAAEQRYAQIVASGKTIPWSAMRTYLEDRLSGKDPSRPLAKKLAR